MNIAMLLVVLWFQKRIKFVLHHLRKAHVSGLVVGLSYDEHMEPGGRAIARWHQEVLMLVCEVLLLPKSCFSAKVFQEGSQ